MTDSGGGRDSWQESADSWFRPSENRHRTQSVYQDPQEGQEEGEETVFPDSGGYAGLSASRPEMVEPYPEALGGPPPEVVSSTPEPAEAPPDPVVPSYGGISYPGASPAAHRPLTRVPGEERPEWETSRDEYPNVAASAEVPLPPEEPETDGGTSESNSWDPGAFSATETEASTSASEEWASQSSYTNAEQRSTEPSTTDPWVSGSSPSPGAEAWLPEEPVRESDAWSSAGSVSSDAGAWVSEEPVRESGTWVSEESARESDAWSSAGSVSSDAGAWSSEEPAREPGTWAPGGPEAETSDTHRWGDDPLSGAVSDGYDDELSPGPRPAPRSETDLGGDLGTGSGNTWAFSRDDPRLPDVVREAEERRRATAEEGPRYTDWDNRNDDHGDGLGPTDPGANVSTSDDPLAAIADMQSRARVEEQRWDEEPQEGTVDGGLTEPRDASGPAGYGGHGPADGGATQMFDPPAFTDEGIGTVPAGVPSDLGSVPSYGERSGVDDRVGYESDGGHVDHWEDDQTRGRHESAPDVATDRDDEYDDFSPADYGMPERPQRGSRRRRSISEDFPGFDDRPPGASDDDGYPGYDSVDFLADTERGATVTLWLGVASLLPFVGVLAALPALLVTGPRAKREIRESRGQLDGLGLITAGTVLAVIGIVVTMISVLIAFVW